MIYWNVNKINPNAICEEQYMDLIEMLKMKMALSLFDKKPNKNVIDDYIEELDK
ncbi:MAG: hypothetical protein ACOC5T_02540 [Elusimicrobiota bacterium]